MSSEARTIRFSGEDLALFSQASGDRNPLHLDAAYARATSYGQQVVFGALGAVAALAALPSDQPIAQITADFSRPMFLDTNYVVEAREQADVRIIRLLDGSTPVLSLRVKRSDRSAAAAPATRSPHFEQYEARVMEHEPQSGVEFSGQYASDPTALDLLCKRWKVSVDPFVLETLLWSSYFVGMELPGRTALFFRFIVNFENAPKNAIEFKSNVKVESFDRILGQMRASFQLHNESGTIASGEYRAFVRPVLAESAEEIPTSDTLAGKVALLIGASRGLGATLIRVLEAQGAKVIGISRAVQGDASDPSVLAKVREQVLIDHGRLDFLICNACPSILPLRVEPATLERIDAYISRALALVAQPIASFIDLLEASGGCNIVISSTAVENPVREWPHYVAAKKAVEGFAQVTVMQYPKTSMLIVRPEKLLTEMTNTPMGRRGAMSPAIYALKIASRLAQPLQTGTAEIFTSPA